MIDRLVRLVQSGLAILGLAWIAVTLSRILRQAYELVGLVQRASASIEGVDPVSGDRYGVRLTPLGPDELRQARDREAAVRRDPELFAARG